MKTCLYKICQCTYGILQTVLGLLLFLIKYKKPHYNFHGAAVTEWEYGSSVSLGMFIFVSDKNKGAGESERHRRLIVHEYGHTLQSLVLGPLYLIIIGIPSFLWAAVPFFRRLRRERGISYYAFYTESWANAWGEGAAGKKPSGDF
ncbi:MAG TPA: hypothetical protein DDX91_07490 [Ruminococcaceae bacterium]|nr:hypothetical protein [Oscillospiraceae bacterium]